MSKKNKYPKNPKSYLNSGHYHEACDRAYLMANFIEDSLKNHPVFQKHEKLKKKINNILDELANIYQVTGSLESKKIDEEEYNSKSKS